MADKGCRIAQVAMAKVRILKGVYKGRRGDDRHADHKDTMHLPLSKAQEGVALGEYEIIEVIEPGMPHP